MYDLCDAAVILAGGFGTLDELFEPFELLVAEALTPTVGNNPAWA